jgi:hypothetical protein
VAYLLGYGSVAFPGPKGGFWVYLLGPVVGAQVGVLGLSKASGCPSPLMMHTV